jgi:hypothetical protein
MSRRAGRDMRVGTCRCGRTWMAYVPCTCTRVACVRKSTAVSVQPSVLRTMSAVPLNCALGEKQAGDMATAAHETGACAGARARARAAGSSDDADRGHRAEDWDGIDWDSSEGVAEAGGSDMDSDADKDKGERAGEPGGWRSPRACDGEGTLLVWNVNCDICDSLAVGESVYHQHEIIDACATCYATLDADSRAKYARFSHTGPYGDEPWHMTRLQYQHLATRHLATRHLATRHLAPPAPY